MKRLLLLAVVAMFLLAPAMAFEFDNVKSYNSTAKEATFYNSILGIPISKIGTAKLDSPQVVYVMPGENRKVAEFTINLEDTSYENFLKNIELQNKNRNNLPVKRPITLKYKTTTYENITDYKQECKGTGKYTEGDNKTEIQDCKYVESGSHLKPIDKWTEMPSKDLEKGTVTIGIFTKVLPGDSVEWIPTLFGVKVDEWASWTSSFNVGLRAYYNFTSTSSAVNNDLNELLARDGSPTLVANGTSFPLGAGVSAYLDSNDCYQPISPSGDIVFNNTAPATFNLWVRGINSVGATRGLLGKDSHYGSGWEILYPNTEAIKFMTSSVTFATALNPAPSSWNMLTLTSNATDLCLSVNATTPTCRGSSTYSAQNTLNFTLGCLGIAPDDWFINGWIDEFGVWNRTLSWDSEIPSLYNEGSGLTWQPDTIPANLTITLNSPANAMKSNVTTQTFNCSSSTTLPGFTIQNMTLYVYLANGTIDINFTDTSGLAVTDYQHVTTIEGLSDGSHKWTCDVSDDENYTIADNRTFMIDTTQPNIIILTPTNITYNVNVTDLNYTATDVNIQACWYSIDDGVTNISLTDCDTNATDVTSIEGSNTWTMYANDTLGNQNKTSITFFKDTIKPAIEIAFPENVTYNINVSSLNFTASDINLQTCWYSLDLGVTNTTIACGVNATDLTSIEGSNTWTAYANDTANNYNLTSITFFKDTILPKIDLNTPANGTQYVTFELPYQVLFNFTSTDTNIETCWYDNETGNTTYTCNALFAENFSSGWHTVTSFANDSAGNIGIDNSTTFFVNYVNFTNIIYASPVIEGSTNPITFNMTATYIAMGQMNATIWYNNTPLTTSRYYDSFGFASATANATAPVVATDTNVSFHLNLTINGVNASRNGLGQIVQHLTAPMITNDSCPIGLNISRYFDYANETNLGTITEVDVAVNLVYGPSSNSSLYTINNTIPGRNNTIICINTSLVSNYSVSYGEIQYSKTGYSDNRYYMFSSTQLTADRVNQTLYSLIATKATSFLFTFTNSVLTPYEGYYAALLRWYPGDNIYRSTSWGKTDDKGQTILRVVVEDVDYRVALYATNGSLLKLANPIRFACLTAPCEYSMIVEETPSDYTSVYGIGKSLTYNKTTKIVTFFYNDPTLTSGSMTLSVIKPSGSSTDITNISICSTTGSGVTNILTCNLTGKTGTMKAVAYRTKSPDEPISVLWISTPSAWATTPGLLFWAILFITLSLIGIYNPLAQLLLGLLGLIIAAILGVLPAGIVFASVGLVALIWIAIKNVS